MKKIITLLALGASIASAQAGGYLTNTNQHVSFLRNPARNASTEIDALYSNPAGIAFLKKGWHFSLNSQSAFQTRTIESTFAPFAANADGNTVGNVRTFKGTATAPVIPSIFGAYRTKNWAFGMHLAISGGGGKAEFAGGLPTFEAPIAAIPLGLSRAGITANQYKYDTYMKGRQYIFGLNFVAAYRATKNLSISLGYRLNYANSHYEGYARNIQANINGTMQSVAGFMGTYADQLNHRAQQLQAAGQIAQAQQLQAVAARVGAYSALTQDKNLSVEQDGWGFTPIVGVNYKLGNLHLAARYEFRTPLELRNDTAWNTTGQASFNDGVSTPSDIPALLSLGASYSITKAIRLSAGYHHYYDRQAKMADGKHETLSHGTHEVLAGLEVDLGKRLTLSAGGQITNYGLNPVAQSDLRFSCDSYSIGMGGAYKLSDKLKLNVAYFFTNYDKYTKTSETYTALAPNVPGTDVYARTNHVFGVGLDLSL